MAIGLALQNRPPKIGGHLFTNTECNDWFTDPSISKAVLSHLVSVKKGDEDTDIILKQMKLVSVSFNQTSEELVTATVISIYTHLDDDKLPALAKNPEFQKEMIEFLNDKLKKYFAVRMISS